MTEEQLKSIEDFAAALMSPKEIAIIMQISWPEFQTILSDHTHPAYMAYQRGKLKTITNARLQVIKLAQEGSSVAQQMVKEFIEELNTKEQNELS